MTRTRWRRLRIIGLILILLIMLIGIAYWAHEAIHARQQQRSHVLVCDQNITLGPLAGPFAGCSAVSCLEILPSGDTTSWSFTYC